MKCDYCRKTATYNVQSTIMTYAIDEKENYEPIADDPTDESNYHLCDKHYEEWQGGLID